MYKRKIENVLQSWLDDASHKPLVVKGVRQCGKTCFVFDEIQDCPKARGSLKYFHQDGRYEVMCTGSLLGVNGYKSPEEQKEEEEASIPVGFEDIVDMYPMDFEEWLWANGIKTIHFDYLKKCLNSVTPVEEPRADPLPLQRSRFLQIY